MSFHAQVSVFHDCEESLVRACSSRLSVGFGSAFVAMPTGPGTGPVLQPDFDSVFGNKAAHSDKVNSAGKACRSST